MTELLLWVCILLVSCVLFMLLQYADTAGEKLVSVMLRKWRKLFH
jgi:hypothetical protein